MAGKQRLQEYYAAIHRVVRLWAAVGLFVSACVTNGQVTHASSETIGGSTSFTTEVKTAASIGDIVINGIGNDTIPVKLLVSHGTLSMGTTTGLTFTGPSTGSTLYFTGTRSDINTALATLTYTRNTTGTDTLEMSLVSPGEVFMSDNGHLYEYVSSTLTWTAAKTAAEGRSKYGSSGYLTTITSQAENDFVSARLADAGWMGASDSATEGQWNWVTGPENGTLFQSGNYPSGTPANGSYTNWNASEPNDYQNGVPGEDCGQFLSGSSGKWNDLPCTGSTLPGYVVEYGAPGNMPSVTAQNISITTSDTVVPTTPGAPTTTSPTTDQTPTWTWTASTDSGTGLANPAYTVEWSQDSSFASGVSTATTNTAAFTHAVNLADGTWYVRIQAKDVANNTSSYSTTGIATIDTTGPSAPGLSTSTVKTTSTTPTIAWTASTDNGSGLANPAYTIQRSQSSSFASGVTSATTNNVFYTTPALSEGTWYIRVRAADQLGNTSAWSGTVTYVIDTTAPTTPGAPTTTTPTNDKTPAFSWTASTDNGSGLRNPAYTVEWSQSNSFASGVSSETVNTGSFTPPADLTDGTWYVRVHATDDAGNDSSYSATGSVVIDTTNPVITNVGAASVNSTVQTITWTTDKLSSSRITYGPTTSYGSTTAESDTSPRVTSHSIQLTGLVACTQYHYSIASSDALGNQGTSSDGTFITNGCVGEAAITHYTQSLIASSSGGTVALPTPDGTIELSVPVNFSAYDADFQIKQINPSTAFASIGTPAGVQTVGKAYDLKAMKDTATPITSFSADITVTLPYASSDITGLIESSLAIYRWDTGIGWQKLSGCHVNTLEQTVTCTTPGFSTFAIFGAAKPIAIAQASTRTTTARQVSTATENTQPADQSTGQATTTPQSTPSPSLTSNAPMKTGKPSGAKQDNKLWWLFFVIVCGTFLLFIVIKRRKKDKDD